MAVYHIVVNFLFSFAKSRKFVLQRVETHKLWESSVVPNFGPMRTAFCYSILFPILLKHVIVFALSLVHS